MRNSQNNLGKHLQSPVKLIPTNNLKLNQQRPNSSLKSNHLHRGQFVTDHQSPKPVMTSSLKSNQYKEQKPYQSNTYPTISNNITVNVNLNVNGTEKTSFETGDIMHQL